MSFVSSHFLIPDASLDPPQKFDYARITPPEDFVFTFIGDLHHSGYGLPTFLGEVLKGQSVIFLEGGMWEKKHEKRYQSIANGGLQALRETISAHEELVRREPKRKPVIEYVSEFYRQLYESGIRVACVDYPKNHPKSKTFAHIHQSRLFNVAETFPVQLARDQLMAENICRRARDLRQFVKGFEGISPLRGLAVMGPAHYVVADGLAEAAHRKSISTFSAQVLFTEEPCQQPDDSTQQEDSKGLVAYQNWVRSSD